MEYSNTSFILQPEPTIEITFGEISYMTIRFAEKKTIIKRIQWKLFCFFFPCKCEWLNIKPKEEKKNV